MSSQCPSFAAAHCLRLSALTAVQSINLRVCWLQFIGRPSELKRPLRPLLPSVVKNSTRPGSGYMCEDYLHYAETIGNLCFLPAFDKAEINVLLKAKGNRPHRDVCKQLHEGMKHAYLRLCSVIAFLHRGADDLHITAEEASTVAGEERLKKINDLARWRRNLFAADVWVLACLIEDTWGKEACTPNLHALVCLMGRQIEKKGHCQSELCVERSVRHLLLPLLLLLLSCAAARCCCFFSSFALAVAAAACFCCCSSSFFLSLCACMPYCSAAAAAVCSL